MIPPCVPCKIREFKKTMQLPRVLVPSKWMCTVNPWTIRCIPILILAVTIHLIQKTIDIITGMSF